MRTNTSLVTSSAVTVILGACSDSHERLGHAKLAIDVDAAIVIRQVYGGGSNTAAPFTHDFVELFNRSPDAVSLTGWSLQYASATGTGNFGATAS